MKLKLKLNLSETLTKYKRVLILAKKPSIDELKNISRICLIGFFIIGIISFVFHIISIVA